MADKTKGREKLIVTCPECNETQSVMVPGGEYWRVILTCRKCGKNFIVEWKEEENNNRV